jgi:microcystin-dependent protein
MPITLNGTTGVTYPDGVLQGSGVPAPGTNGNLLTSNGTTWLSQAPAPSFPSGGIIMWSGSIASIPSGWLLCNGTSGTPDLRDRFVVGAGSTYAVAATGGSANAVVVSHTHTATSTVTDPGHNHTFTDYPSANVRAGSNGATPFVPTTTNTSTATTGITVGTTVNTAGVSGTNANLPPYYALAYIMKS